jgi:hypothetical protein
MACLQESFCGMVLIPLASLKSTGFGECPSAFSLDANTSQFQEFLFNNVRPITTVVDPETLAMMLQNLRMSPMEFKETNVRPVSFSSFPIDCLLGDYALERARALLGDEFVCIAKVYCIATGESPPTHFCQILAPLLTNI